MSVVHLVGEIRLHRVPLEALLWYERERHFLAEVSLERDGTCPFCIGKAGQDKSELGEDFGNMDVRQGSIFEDTVGKILDVGGESAHRLSPGGIYGGRSGM
jgi:hypothetical protein